MALGLFAVVCGERSWAHQAFCAVSLVAGLLETIRIDFAQQDAVNGSI
jgi:hypothetical protein